MLDITLEELLNLIEDAFLDEIYAYLEETHLGVNVYIEGKDKFLNKIKKDLENYQCDF